MQGYHLIESITKYYQGRARMVAKVSTWASVRWCTCMNGLDGTKLGLEGTRFTRAWLVDALRLHSTSLINLRDSCRLRVGHSCKDTRPLWTIGKRFSSWTR